MWLEFWNKQQIEFSDQLNQEFSELTKVSNKKLRKELALWLWLQGEYEKFMDVRQDNRRHANNEKAESLRKYYNNIANELLGKFISLLIKTKYSTELEQLQVNIKGY